MTTSPVMGITDELVAELERSVECVWPETDHAVVALRALLAERAELKQEVGRLNARLLLSSAHAASTVASCMAQVSGIAGAAAELKRDADRYRWLRSRLVGASFDWDDEGMTVLAFEMPPSLSIGADCDRNIDAAMQSEAKP